MEHVSIQPIQPVAPYLGGKIKLAKTVIERIEAINHTTYAEPFVGMGGVFLRRPFRARVEVINDYNREIANLFRVLQSHYMAFMEIIRFQITSRVEFNRLVDIRPETLTDLERAARFLYIQRVCFGGKPSGHNFGVSPNRPARFNVTKLRPMLEDLHTRLADVVIECLDFGEFLTRYDRKETLFYLDPPYYGCENDYGKDLFCRADFERLAGTLEGLKGRFLLSLNDKPEVRDIFAGFDIEEVTTRYSVANTANGHESIGELIISDKKDGRYGLF